MDDDGLVADESIAAGISRQIEVCVLGKETSSKNSAMLAAQITNLASSWITWVARRLFTAVVRVQVLPSGSAIAVCWYGADMNVISC